ncbi:MAG TPA: hypothetical protein VFI12_02890 [Thermomicrobiales bacterium]|nr:hypothetical protein [Thermomicrobiales bacterium]
MSIYDQREHNDDDTHRLQAVGAEILGLPLGEIEREGTTANMTGIQSSRYQLTSRTDSRTIFLQDSEFQAQGGVGVFEGNDDELLERAARILSNLGIDEREIDQRSVLTEQIEAASFDRRTGAVASAGVRDGKRFALLTRAIDGIPIWQSSVTLGLTRDGSPGYLHLHWPEIERKVLDMARGYLSAESSGWSPPTIDYAEPESWRAGVLHSPAISLVLDQIAAIKVIYRPLTDEIGKKPVRFVDLDGRDVPLPRHFEETPGPVDEKRPGANAA